MSLTQQYLWTWAIVLWTAVYPVRTASGGLAILIAGCLAITAIWSP